MTITNPWITCPKPNSQAQIRLFCFPYAGAGASIFRTWPDLLPAEIEVFAVQLPGRESRLRDPLLTNLQSLIENLSQALLPYLDRPFAFFGHSVGSLICFELARQLRRQNYSSPLFLFVSGRHAPQISASYPSIHQLPEAEFIEELRHYKGTPEAVLKEPELMSLFLPILRADLAINENYVYTCETPFDFPISAFGGLQDSKVSHEDLDNWRKQTNSDFTLHLLPGDHFFLHSASRPLLQTLSQKLLINSLVLSERNLLMQDTAANHGKSSQPFVRPLTALFTTAILAIGGITAYSFRQSSQTGVEANPETSKLEIKTVTALGRLEPSGEVIQVFAPSSTQGNRVEELLVKEGDYLVKGQIMAILDSRTSAAALQRAEQGVRVAQAKLTQIKAGAKQGEIKAQKATIKSLEAELRGVGATNQAKIARLEAQLQGERAEKAAAIERLEAELGNAEREFQRYQQLAQEGVISDSDLDLRRLNLERAGKQLAEAKAALSKSIAPLREEIRETQASATATTDTLNKKIQAAKAELERIAEVRPVDVEVAAAEVKQAQAEVAKARAELDLAYIKAPQAGRVLDILTRPGEIVSSDGLARIGQTNQMYAVAEVYESDIGKIHLGQQVKITSNAISGELQGTVARIGLEVQRQQVINTDPAASIDAKVVEVRVRLDEDSSQKIAGLTNLLVKIAIGVHGS